MKGSIFLKFTQKNIRIRLILIGPLYLIYLYTLIYLAPYMLCQIKNCVSFRIGISIQNHQDRTSDPEWSLWFRIGRVGCNWVTDNWSTGNWSTRSWSIGPSGVRTIGQLKIVSTTIKFLKKITGHKGFFFKMTLQLTNFFSKLGIYSRRIGDYSRRKFNLLYYFCFIHNRASILNQRLHSRSGVRSCWFRENKKTKKCYHFIIILHSYLLLI